MTIETKDGMWVLFDTAARSDRPVYYRDVHNVIAMPRNSVIRYTYREKYLSAEAVAWAVQAADGHGQEKRPVVAVYCQKPDYVRRSDSPQEDVSTDDLLWCATRLGSMENVTWDGRTFYFDFVLGAYPEQNDEAYRRLFSSLAQAGDVPFRKWCSIARLDDSSVALLSDPGVQHDTSRWSEIVYRLGASPMQFAGDVFWRLRALRRRGGSIIKPKRAVVGDAKDARRAEWYYEIQEGQAYELEVGSLTAKADGSAVAQTQPILGISVSSSSDLALQGSNAVTLRPQNSDAIVFTAKRSDSQDQRFVSIALKVPDSGEWPTSAGFEIPLRLVKASWRFIVAIVLGLLGVCGMIAATITTFSATQRVLAGVLAMLCFLLAGLVATGKFTAKGVFS